MLKNKDKIDNWLTEMKIGNFSINDDLTVDVKGNVYLASKSLESIPVQFGHVEGSFHCNDNNLTSLVGAPHIVGDNFYCDNNRLTTLKGCPQEIKGEFFCDANKLESLLNGPRTVGLSFSCSFNKLTTLQFCPRVVGGDFDCSNNNLLSLKIKDLPQEVQGKFYFKQDLKLIELESLYDDNGWVKCKHSTLKRTLNAYALNEKLQNNLPGKSTSKTIKV